MHVYETDYLRLLNKCKGNDLERHISLDKVACIDMHIHLITEDNLESNNFYGLRIWYYALSIMITQYYLMMVPGINESETFKTVTYAQLKALSVNPTRNEIEDYIENRKQLIREIELYERARAQEQRKAG